MGDKLKISKEDKQLYLDEIERLKEAKALPDMAKKLMETEEWKEVIEKVYMDDFSVDLTRNYENMDEDAKAIFDEEYKVRSRFYNTVKSWSEQGNMADQQIARYNQLLSETEVE
jgi:hypothetical protein